MSLSNRKIPLTDIQLKIVDDLTNVAMDEVRSFFNVDTDSDDDDTLYTGVHNAIELELYPDPQEEKPVSNEKLFTLEELRIELAAIWARLYRDRADDALYMAGVILSDEEKQKAIEDFERDEKADDDNENDKDNTD